MAFIRIAMEGVMSLIERQRQEHETLLRALATGEHLIYRGHVMSDL